MSLFSFFFVMLQRPPRSTRTDTLLPYTTLFRAGRASVQKSLLMGSDYGVSTMVRGQPRVHKLWRLKHLVVKAWDNPIVDKITVGSRLAQRPNDPAQIGRASCRESGGHLV